jgi:signal transduction histidine kinase
VQPILEPTIAQPELAERDQILLVGSGPGLVSASAGLVPLLEAFGCDVTAAEDAAAALRAVGEQEYRLAFLNVDVAVLDGRSTLRVLQERAPGLRVVVLAASPSVPSVVEAFRWGAYDFLQTPVAPAALRACLERARRQPDLRERACLDALRALTPGLVHEMRNPLAGLLPASEWVARRLLPGDSAQPYMEIVRQGAREMERLLARLAQFGHVIPGGPFPTRPLDLVALLEHALDTVKAACQARGIRRTLRLVGQAPEVMGDPGRFGLACSEILRNATEAMPEGGELTLSIRNSPAPAPEPPGLWEDRTPAPDGGVPPAGSAGWAEIECTDTGSGMTDEVRRRAFEPFFSTRPRALGIGLPLAQAIALAHGGMVRLGPPPPRGTRILLGLPAAAIPAGDGNMRHADDPHR